jgi:nucleolar protein 4
MAPKRATKSTENTVFVRFTPASSEVSRNHLEEFFSEIGPIKKCSVISSKEKGGLGYGFVKFVASEDAEEAEKSCNGKSLTIQGKNFKLKVELASQPTDRNHQDHPRRDDNARSTETTVVSKEKWLTEKSDDLENETLTKRKRTSRVIIRNLSFYANEQHIRSAMEKEFGPVLEVTLPRVDDKLHRGFAFVTFEHVAHARQATAPRKKPLEIKKRPVAIDFAVSKTVHQKTHQQEEARHGYDENKEDSPLDNDEFEKGGRDNEDDDDDDDDDNEEHRVDDNDESESQEEGESDDKHHSEDRVESEEQKEAPEVDEAVVEHKTVFIRNLPFDTTRTDIFELMRKFGHIESIHPVMNQETGVFKGTAFCEFTHPGAATRALEAAGSTDAMETKQNNQQGDGVGLYLRGRHLRLDLAIDKRTASTLSLEKQGGRVPGRDRRYLYLAKEGYVANQSPDADSPKLEAWESLPEGDQLKRQRAQADKNTKLKSPLFFINPNRLSIRNLAKHVDEAEFKKLCVTGTQRGLAAGLVNEEDIICYWRATGDMSARDIVKRVNESKEKNEPLIPEFDTGNIKQYIPSVFIDRDVTSSKREKAPSRGFGFVDFTHHAHALACLRELNNNHVYTADYVAGGKKATDAKRSAKRKKKKDSLSPGEFVSNDGRVLIPRLIVEFTVENKAKAQKQATNRAKQQANIEKQRLEQREKRKEIKEEGKKTKSRGKKQREKKRKQREQGDAEPEIEETEDQKATPKQPLDDTGIVSPMKVKPSKKRKTKNADDQNFDKLVKSYADSFSSSMPTEKDQARSKLTEKRWFD